MKSISNKHLRQNFTKSTKEKHPTIQKTIEQFETWKILCGECEFRDDTISASQPLLLTEIQVKDGPLENVKPS